MKTELLRRFVTVADEKNLTRAAEKLYVTQPILSRQIARLEKQVGVPLFLRTIKGMNLTPAGDVLYDCARDALALLDQGIRDAKIANKGRIDLKIGLRFPSEVMIRILRVVKECSPEVNLEFRRYGFEDTSCGLASGKSDAAFLWLPIDTAVESIDILSEPMVAVLSGEHPLAHETEISIQSILHDPLVGLPVTDMVWMDYWYALSYRGGVAPSFGFEANGIEEWLLAISLGRGIGLGPSSIQKSTNMYGLSFVPVIDVEPASFVLAQRAGSMNPALSKLTRAIDDRVRGDECPLDGGLDELVLSGISGKSSFRV